MQKIKWHDCCKIQRNGFLYASIFSEKKDNNNNKKKKKKKTEHFSKYVKIQYWDTLSLVLLKKIIFCAIKYMGKHCFILCLDVGRYKFDKFAWLVMCF